MADDKNVKAQAQSFSDPTFSKEQLLQAKEFDGVTYDILVAVLDENQMYSKREVYAMIDDFKKAVLNNGRWYLVNSK